MFLYHPAIKQKQINKIAAIANAEERIAKLTEYHQRHKETSRSMVLLSAAHFENDDTYNALKYNELYLEKHFQRLSGKHTYLHNKLLYSMVAELTADVADQSKELEEWLNDCRIENESLANQMRQILILSKLYVTLRNRDLDGANQWVGQIDRQTDHWLSSLGIILEAEYHCQTGNKEKAAELIHIAKEHISNRAYLNTIARVEALIFSD